MTGVYLDTEISPSGGTTTSREASVYEYDPIGDLRAVATNVITFTPRGATPYTVVASAQGIGDLTWKIYVYESVTALIDSGNNQTGTPAQTLENPLVVRVVDKADAPVEGIKIAWSVASGGGTLGAETATTDANGKAQTTLTLGATAGQNTVTATIVGDDQEDQTAGESDDDEDDDDDTPPAVTFTATATEAADAPAAPDKNAAFHNFPNPFNPETWIPYQLATPAEVSVSIYAADGKLVQTLNLGHQPAGYYTSPATAAHWDGKNNTGEQVASGVYFYTLTAGEFTATRKLIVLK